MPEMKVAELSSFWAWANIFVDTADCTSFPEIDAQINFLGKAGDARYLLINIYTSETSSIEYIFLSASEAQANQNAILIFDFLKKFNFSFAELLSWLAQASYTQHEMGERMLIDGLLIKRVSGTFS